MSPKISTMLRLDLNQRSSTHKKSSPTKTTKPTEEPDTSKKQTRIDLDLPQTPPKEGNEISAGPYTHRNSKSLCVANRTSKILETLTANSWHYVSSTKDPADMATRGINPQNLGNCKLWWHILATFSSRF
ncbi:hypothetical protein CDAR_515071 [Caerostris darwini]|uniref:Uncharacterized protein n=1 Tax=Caerostris darwini TaxID=1538125 RepID=A0AAV4W1J3_9ARAC|nr:hypothetical protein CDAR_515071 [Caerostris darwini]